MTHFSKRPQRPFTRDFALGVRILGQLILSAGFELEECSFDAPRDLGVQFFLYIR